MQPTLTSPGDGWAQVESHAHGTTTIVWPDPIDEDMFHRARVPSSLTCHVWSWVVAA